MACALTWLDVFTERPLTGNGLAVVHDADSVGDDTMLAFARETRLSETSFVQSASERGADYRNRIWMMQGELPFAGHPSLGTAVAVARARGDREVSYTQQTGAGLQPIEVEVGERVARASMLQEPASFGDEVDAEVVLRALGLDAGDAAPDLPPQVVATGLAQIVVPVREAAALDRVAPDAASLRPLLTGAGCVCAYLAFIDPDREAASARSFFVDGGAVVEDPATGSAAGPLMGTRPRAPAPLGSRSTRASRWAGRAGCCARRASAFA
jgi:trans-2,3-dihydro-3-hydroxyanthranilate isomerase